MAVNTTAPGLSVGELEYIQAQVLAIITNSGNPAAVSYPDGSFCQYVISACKAGHAHVPGAPSLAVAEAVKAAIGVA